MMWWQGRMVGFDCETTAPQPEAARIVTAAVVMCGGGVPSVTRTWLADPGVLIPEGATEVHGITTEQAQAEGQPAGEVLADILDALRTQVLLGYPLVIFNARYDLTVLDRECRRHGIDPLRPETLLVVDPFVIDKHLHRYRTGSRKLSAQAEHYRAVLDDAHDAASDAITACRIAYRIGRSGEVIRRVRNADEGRELAALKREWESVRHDLPALHLAQQRWALAERDRFAEYKASQGEDDEAARIRAEVGWPVLEPMAHEDVAA